MNANVELLVTDQQLSAFETNLSWIVVILTVVEVRSEKMGSRGNKSNKIDRNDSRIKIAFISNIIEYGVTSTLMDERQMLQMLQLSNSLCFML
jgi:hypothetical protein